MSRSRERDFSQPELGQALAWLRARRYLTQQQVVAAVNDSGEPISAVYYQMLETGKRLPSAEKLAAVLAALVSDRDELESLVAARVWEGAPSGRYRIRPRPDDYSRAAEEALADKNGEGFWSTPVESASVSFAEGQSGRSPLLRGAGWSNGEPRTGSASVSDPLRGNEPLPGYDAELRGQLAELSDHFLRLSPKRRQELLERARKLNRG